MKNFDLSNHHLGQNADTAKALQSIFNTIEALIPGLMKRYQGQNQAFYTTDFVVFAAAKRTLSLGRSFLAMIAVPNFGVCAALLRMQLDTALRFFALSLVPSQQEFATQMLAGDRIDKLKSKYGDRLTDKYLAEQLSKHWPWITKVYEETSGFIHLSGRHMWQTFGSTNDAERIVNLAISDEDVPRPPSEYLEILEAFDATTKLVTVLLFSYLDSRPKTEQKVPT